MVHDQDLPLRQEERASDIIFRWQHPESAASRKRIEAEARAYGIKPSQSSAFFNRGQLYASPNAFHPANNPTDVLHGDSLGTFLDHLKCTCTVIRNKPRASRRVDARAVEIGILRSDAFVFPRYNKVVKLARTRGSDNNNLLIILSLIVGPEDLPTWFLSYEKWTQLTNLLITKSLNNQGKRTSCQRVANALHGPVYKRTMELLDEEKAMVAKFDKGNKKKDYGVYGKNTVTQLKVLLLRRGLGTGGTKSALCSRLESNDKKEERQREQRLRGNDEGQPPSSDDDDSDDNDDSNDDDNVDQAVDERHDDNEDFFQLGNAQASRLLTSNPASILPRPAAF
jgi:hypothetical protein